MIRGTVNALSFVSEEVFEANNNDKNNLVALFLDFRKAFDAVIDSLLLYTVDNDGIKRKWSHLSESCRSSRYQNTEVFGKFLVMTILDIGENQGAFLGSLSFLNSRIDITDHLLSIKSISFAGDTALICDPKQTETQTVKKNSDLCTSEYKHQNYNQHLFRERKNTVFTNEQRNFHIKWNRVPGTLFWSKIFIQKSHWQNSDKNERTLQCFL